MVNNIVFELYTKFGFPKNSLAPTFDNDDEKIISKPTSASEFMSDSLLKRRNSFPDTPFDVFFVNTQYVSDGSEIGGVRLGCKCLQSNTTYKIQ